MTFRLLATRAGRRGITGAPAGAVVAAAVVLAVSACGGSGQPAAQITRPPAKPAHAAQAKALTAQAPRQAPGVTEVATIVTAAPKYARPGVREAGSVPLSWWNRQSVLPVLQTAPGWVRVRLAQRPNGSTAWVRASDVTLGATPYRIVVDLATTHLRLYDRDRLVMSAPAGVGAVGDPTPTGDYFVAFDEQPPQPNPGYGPFIVVTSDHSTTIADWERSGDAIIGIHGPLGDDAEIGTTGARISSGCVRLHVKALTQLADVPPGTPIDVIG